MMLLHDMYTYSRFFLNKWSFAGSQDQQRLEYEALDWWRGPWKLESRIRTKGLQGIRNAKSLRKCWRVYRATGMRSCSKGARLIASSDGRIKRYMWPTMWGELRCFLIDDDRSWIIGALFSSTISSCVRTPSKFMTRRVRSNDKNAYHHWTTQNSLICLMVDFCRTQPEWGSKSLLHRFCIRPSTLIRF